MNIACDDGHESYFRRFRQFDETGVLCSNNNTENETQNETKNNQDDEDAFDQMVVQAPKLENSFSQWIMADEIKADLPTNSQKAINHNLHERVQRVENLVAMLMQQKNDEMELLLK